MAQEIAVITPIPLPSNPAQLPSLPGWLQQRSAALGNATQPDATGKYRQTPILPPDLILTSSERAEVERHISALERFTRLDQPFDLRGATMTNDQAHGVMIASLLLKGGAKLDQQSSDAFTEDYLDAIEDLPAWAVREAIRKWNRADSPRLDGKAHNYDFRPAPPTLRRLSHHEVAGVKGRIIEMQRLLTAEPLVEYSDEHRQEMLNRVASLFKQPVMQPMSGQHQEAAE